MQTCACDLCGSQEHRAFPEWLTKVQRIAVCSRCGLIYTNPRPDADEVLDMYEEEFRNDPGAAARGDDDTSLRQRHAREAHLARTLVLPHLEKHVDPAGKRWLEIRFRTGALLGELQKRGAIIHGVDLFDRTVAWARGELGCDRLHQTTVHDLLGPIPGPIDVVSMMSIHVLAHTPSPSELLRGVHERLTPGGMLFLEEKDVTRIPGFSDTSPLRYPGGMAHYVHLTINTAKALVRKAGFDLVHADFWPRTSALRHFVIVARKGERPGEHLGDRPPGGWVGQADDPEWVYRRIIRNDRLVPLRRMSRLALPIQGLWRTLRGRRKSA